MVQPWDEDAFQSQADAFIFPAARLKPFGTSVQVSELESQGRWRFGGEDEHGPAVAYALNFLSLSQRKGLLPGQLTDISVGGAAPLGRVGDWSFAASAALGYAGDRPFATGTAWYGRASVLVGRTLRPGTQLLLLLEYDGNRGIIPDVPLPAVEYRSKVSDAFQYVVGYPTTAIIWNPTDRLEVDLNWYVPDSFDATAEYTLGQHWSVFGAFGARDLPFHASTLAGNRRIFFTETRFEVGIRYRLNDAFNVVLASGYAIDRRFWRGYDEIDLERIAALPDQPYLRVGLSLSF